MHDAGSFLSPSINKIEYTARTHTQSNANENFSMNKQIQHTIENIVASQFAGCSELCAMNAYFTFFSISFCQNFSTNCFQCVFMSERVMKFFYVDLDEKIFVILVKRFFSVFPYIQMALLVDVSVFVSDFLFVPKKNRNEIALFSKCFHIKVWSLKSNQAMECLSMPKSIGLCVVTTDTQAWSSESLVSRNGA